MTITNKQWWKAAMVRAIKTFAQTAASLITVGSLMSEISWSVVFSSATVALVYSLLTSLAGIPEISEEEGVN
jgi:ABC-type multidrug transport system permease subunit